MGSGNHNKLKYEESILKRLERKLPEEIIVVTEGIGWILKVATNDEVLPSSQALYTTMKTKINKKWKPSPNSWYQKYTLPTHICLPDANIYIWHIKIKLTIKL